MIIIGITGTLGAGKGTIVDYLITQKRFSHFSVREFLTTEIHKRGLEVNRVSMTSVANELRAGNSPSFITDKLFEMAKMTGGNCVIESIRTPGEIESLRKKGKFYLFAVVAKTEFRFERIRQRASETDHIDFETFLSNEKREMTTNNPNNQNLKKCIGMADFIFENNGTQEQLIEKVTAVLSKIDRDNDSGNLTRRFCCGR
jgi:dephospho-CoA kinase